MNAVKSHHNCRDGQYQAELKYKGVKCIPFIFKSLEQDYWRGEHQQKGIAQVDQTFNQQFFIGSQGIVSINGIKSSN